MSKESKDKQNTTLIATQGEPDLEFLRSFGTGALDSLSQRDIIMPRYKLIQNTSKTGTPGKWVSNLDPDREFDELHIIILEISNYRTYFPPKGENGDKPLCRSNDGYKKSDPNGIGDGDCDSCRYAQWKNDASGRGIKPACSSGYTMLGLIVLPEGGMEPGMISFKGSAIKPCKSFFTRMKTRGIPPFAYITVIGSESVTNDKGRFFKPSFDFGPYLNEETIRFAAAQGKMYKEYISRDIMADDSREDDDDSPGDGVPGAASFLDKLEDTSGPTKPKDDQSLQF